MESVARYTNSPFPPRKMRLLADLVRLMDVDKAIFVLKLHPKRMYATELGKVLRSAIANWQVSHPDNAVEDSELYVKMIKIDGARALKRVQPAPQGRAYRKKKRFNHITVVLGSRVSDSVESFTTQVEEAFEAPEAPASQPKAKHTRSKKETAA